MSTAAGGGGGTEHHSKVVAFPTFGLRLGCSTDLAIDRRGSEKINKCHRVAPNLHCLKILNLRLAG